MQINVTEHRRDNPEKLATTLQNTGGTIQRNWQQRYRTPEGQSRETGNNVTEHQRDNPEKLATTLQNTGGTIQRNWQHNTKKNTTQNMLGTTIRKQTQIT